MSMGEQIKTARQLRGFTQEELGERCGIGAANIRKYESGKQIPRIVTLQKIAEALDLPVSSFLPAFGITESLGNRIRTVRKRQGLSVAELGERLEISGSHVGRYERGEENPKPSTIHRFADALGVDAHWLETGIYDESLSSEEQQLLRYFRLMNPKGRIVALERMDELSTHPNYKRRI